jgi:hypothetical protein
MYLHAAYAAKTSSCVVVKTPDTDVFIIGVSLAKKLPCRVLLHTGKGANLRTLDLDTIHEVLGSELSTALIGLHCFTGCDSVSALYGKGKKKALKLLVKNRSFCEVFQRLGGSYEVTEDMMTVLEKFVCKLYGLHDCSEVNQARHRMFCLGKSELMMPPNKDSLLCHVQRANYQASIYKQSLVQMPSHPPPVGHGWQMENGELTIHWGSLPPAPESILELVNCTGRCRRTNCSDSEKCTCLENGIPCTDLCKCKRDTCSNVSGQVDDTEDESDISDSEAENSDLENPL